MARKRDEDKKSGGPSYMVLYANLMTLLMTFFIVLVSMGSIQEEKVKAGVGAFRKALLSGGLGILWENKPVSFDYLIQQEKMRIRKEISASLKKSLETEMKKEGLAVATTEEGVVLKLPGKVLFDLGKAELKPGAKKTLNKVIPLFKKYPYNIWELSAARAISVIKYLHQNGIPQERLSALGYGEYRPVAPNDTPEHRSLNRRIEILIKVTTI